MKYLCGWLNVSRSGYYDWRTRQESARSKTDRHLLSQIIAIYQASRGTYGSPRIHKVLQSKGVWVGRKRVARLMRVQHIQGRAYRVSTRRPMANRYYNEGGNIRLELGQPTAMNQVWVADVTYLRLGKDWMYLTTIMDVYSRRLLSWSLGRQRNVDLTLGVLKRAIQKRKPSPGLIFHTDRGIEFVSPRIQEELDKHGIQRSVNRPQHCTDNAHMESFYHTLKGELIRGRKFKNVRELRYALSGYLNSFYNYIRLHSGIGYLPPVKYEQMAT